MLFLLKRIFPVACSAPEARGFRAGTYSEVTWEGAPSGYYVSWDFESRRKRIQSDTEGTPSLRIWNPAARLIVSPGRSLRPTKDLRCTHKIQGSDERGNLRDSGGKCQSMISRVFLLSQGRDFTAAHLVETRPTNSALCSIYT